ncbi:MAG: glycosyltransferase family 39 protein [Candidatus Promineofilum sp.]|nr:glycosyltransferase family 39 protein [Promineifilum sp.]
MMDRPATRVLERGILVAALLLFFALAAGAALALSPTNDEPIHLTRGAALSQSGDLGLQFEHTPLSHRLIGALLPAEPTLPLVEHLATRPTNDRPAIARELFWESGLNVERAIFLGRLPIIWSGLLLGAALALWVTGVARRPAALAVALLLYATSPNLLASAALATTDLLAAATFFAAVCGWWFYWQRPGRTRWVVTAVLLGLALSAKLTGVLLIPVLFVLAYARRPRDRWWRPGLAALGLLPVAGLVLWAVYAFQIGPWRGIMVPAPAYWESWASVLTHVSGGHQAFFVGHVSGSGWWLYFPVTLAIKTPLPTLLLLAAALVVTIRARRWPLIAFVLVPIAATLAAAIYSRLNIGYRHVLPIIPFVLLLIGSGVPSFRSHRTGRWLAGAAVAWAVVAALWVHPHHLAYFNELIGGPARGYRYLGDSNLDWGQGLNELAEFAASFEGDLHVSYGGAADPAYYGLDQPPLAGPEGAGGPDFHPANPAPGRYSISAGHIQGLLPEADLFDWFRRREPDGSIGYSILFYDVDAARPGAWIAQCAAPAPPLVSAEAERIIGAPGARHLSFDCASSWVFPGEGAPGWYILPFSDDPWWVQTGPVVAGEMTHVYRHRANQFGPDYDVYYWPGSGEPEDLLGPAATEPLLTGGPAELWNYAVNGEEWLTLWRVALPATAPLSVQAHLYAADGPPQVADGLGYSSGYWQPGDWFVQRHPFATPGGMLETGLYNYVTLERAGPAVKLPAR